MSDTRYYLFLNRLGKEEIKEKQHASKTFSDDITAIVQYKNLIRKYYDLLKKYASVGCIIYKDVPGRGKVKVNEFTEHRIGQKQRALQFLAR